MECYKINCPLCCKKKFNSLDELKNHILETTKSLTCPGCENNYDDLYVFLIHLDECESKGTADPDYCSVAKFNESSTQKCKAMKDNVSLNNDIAVLEKIESHENEEFYCEICNVHFLEMKQHLMEYHMGQEVVVESQNLEKVLEESEIHANYEPILESIHSIPDSGKIFLEQDDSNDNGTVQSTCVTKPPIVENIIIFNDLVTPSKNQNFDMIKTYRCQRCKIRFSQFINYSKHNCNIKGGEVCDICSVHFDTKAALAYHKRKLHRKYKLNEKVETECDICHVNFPSSKSMILHKKMHSTVVKSRTIDPPATYNITGLKIPDVTDEVFTCHICGKQYNKQYEDVHIKSHVEEFYNCLTCNRKFSSQNDLNMHAQVHGNNEKQKLSCKFCKKKFTNEDSLTYHTENHCLEKKFSCNFCGRRFLRPHEKVKHERIHTGQKPHVCEVCGKAFRVGYCLTLHLRTHSGIRPYHCKTCGKRFKSHSVFNHHIQTHSDLRPYKCPYCPKSFKTTVQLAGHKNTHTKPFTCTVCNRPFATLYAVRLHIKSHEEQNNLTHQCHICGAVYARHFALRDHLLTHNKDTKNERKKFFKKTDIVGENAG